MNRTKWKYRWRGKRIGKRDDRLVLRSVILFTVFIILIVSWLIYGDKLYSGNWTRVTKNEFYSGTVGGLLLSAVLLCLYYKKTGFEKLIKRQRICTMILQNGWYESERIKWRNNYERITYFPRIYYKEEGQQIFFVVKISMGKYQDKLLHLEEKLETGLACELINRYMQGVYLHYTFLQEVERNRITVSNVRAENGSLLLMRHISWAYDAMPHMLIAGDTGSGKTSFLMAIIEALVNTDAMLYIVDPKNVDLAYLGKALPEVHYEKEAILDCIQRFYEKMVQRTKEMKERPDFLMGMNYADLGFSPEFLIFDEYVAFMDMLGKKEWEEPMILVRKIIMLGRQAGFFLILACQRPDAKYLGDGVRDQFGFRAALGKMSESGYNMMFGNIKKEYQEKESKGRGYVNAGNGVITEFYAPFVPKGHDFFAEIKALYERKNNANTGMNLTKVSIPQEAEQPEQREPKED